MTASSCRLGQMADTHRVSCLLSGVCPRTHPHFLPLLSLSPPCSPPLPPFRLPPPRSPPHSQVQRIMSQNTPSLARIMAAEQGVTLEGEDDIQTDRWVCLEGLVGRLGVYWFEDVSCSCWGGGHPARQVGWVQGYNLFFLGVVTLGRGFCEMGGGRRGRVQARMGLFSAGAGACCPPPLHQVPCSHPPPRKQHLATCQLFLQLPPTPLYLTTINTLSPATPPPYKTTH